MLVMTSVRTDILTFHRMKGTGVPINYGVACLGVPVNNSNMTIHTIQQLWN